MEFYQCTIKVFGGGVTLGFDEKGVGDVVLDDSVCLFVRSVHFRTSSGSGATIVEMVAPVAEVVEPGTAPGLASVPRTMPRTFSLRNFTVIRSFHIS